MNLLNQAVCKRCGRKMDSVAEIAPRGRDPGLLALICEACGAADSVLVYPAKPPEVDRAQFGAKHRISGHAKR
jgi:hypothetical protein